MVKDRVNRGIHDRQLRDYSIGGSCPQHIENWRRKRFDAVAVAASHRASRAAPDDRSSGWPRRPPAPARNRHRTDPTHTASANGSSRRAARRPGRDDRLRDAVARADHQVVAVEVETLDGVRKERQVSPVLARRANGSCCTNDVVIRCRSIVGDTDPRTVEQREDVRVGIAARTAPRGPFRRRACRSASRGRARPHRRHCRPR